MPFRCCGPLWCSSWAGWASSRQRNSCHQVFENLRRFSIRLLFLSKWLRLPVLFVTNYSVPRIADGFELAAQASIKNLDKIADEFKIDLKDTSNLVKNAKSIFGSKVMNKCPDKIAILPSTPWWPWPTSRPRTFLLSHLCIAGGEEDLKKSKW